ncbi:MAG TPA: hypothetical protein VMM80_05565 [Bacteroidota bacterium]|nr:hypothetical protein [Bacteroidota bacterium]
MRRPAPDRGAGVPGACPHCGKPLSPWQQVLLSVDRAIVCKNCWYRIILDVYEEKGKRGEKGHTPQ